MTAVPDRSTFENIYAGQAPWEIGRPQKALLDVADRIAGSVLDAGGGTDENALYFAGRGCTVTGIDFLEEPIRRARRKANERGRAGDVPRDGRSGPEVFDPVIDSGLFHVFNDEDRLYIEGLATVLKPDGRLFLPCFSDEEPGTQGPRQVSKDELLAVFAGGWEIESVEPSRYEVRPDLKELSFLDGGPRAWFVVVRRVGV